MTRINVVPPMLLSQQHIGGEWHEIPRMYGYVDASIERGEFPSDSRNPITYRLGTGHVRFFYPRMGFVYLRHLALYEELKRRGYRPSYDPVQRHKSKALVYKSKGFLGVYKPTPDAVRINMARLRERGGFYPEGVEDAFIKELQGGA